MFRLNPAIIRFTSKGYQRFVRVTTMRLCKDGEISSSGFNYVIIKNLVGEGGGSVKWVCADMGCGASAGIIPYAAVLCIGHKTISNLLLLFLNLDVPELNISLS